MKMPEAVAHEYRWTNPANDRVPESSVAWKPVELRYCETIPDEASMLESYRYNDKPTYEVRKLYSEAQLREALAQQESEIQRLKSLLRIADIKLAQIEAKDMQDNPDDYVMQY